MQPEKNCLHGQQHRKKLFVLKKFSSPPLQKNNGPSLSSCGTTLAGYTPIFIFQMRLVFLFLLVLCSYTHMLHSFIFVDCLAVVTEKREDLELQPMEGGEALRYRV